jgi:adenylylsulfate kinase
VAHSNRQAFGVWITGLPASGKSTVARALKTQLGERGVDATVLESDLLRKIVADNPGYDEQGRDAFYRFLTETGVGLTAQGVPVIFDATASLRLHRDQARQQIPRFMEVYVECPLSICVARDPKGIYRQALEGTAVNVPGLQAAYEPPEAPDILIHGDRDAPEAAAARVIAKLAEKGYL